MSDAPRCNASTEGVWLTFIAPRDSKWGDLVRRRTKIVRCLEPACHDGAHYGVGDGIGYSWGYYGVPNPDTARP